MPRVPDRILACVVYMYRDATGAELDEGYVGCAFVVEIPSDFGRPFQYLVTNDHVVLQGGAKAARFFVPGTEIVRAIPPDEWEHGGLDDLAAVRISGPGDDNPSGIFGLDLQEMLPTEEYMEELNVGPGDDVFMVGRLAQSRRDTLTPVLRFGNIAMWPAGPVEDGSGLRPEAYLTEMRSVAGDSGSPVFLYVGPGTYRGDGRMTRFYAEHIGLFGVVTGHVLTRSHLYREGVNGDNERVEGLSAYVNSAIAIVSPWYRLRELLNREELVERREEECRVLRRMTC